MPELRGKTWYSNITGPDLEQPGARRRYRLPLGGEVRTKTAAKAAEARLLAQLEARAAEITAASEPGRAAFSGWARKWLDVVVRPGLKPSTLKLYETICRTWLVPHLGDAELSTITPLDIQELLAEVYEEGCGPKWAREVLSCLSSCLGAAVEAEYLSLNPCLRVRKPDVPPQEFAWYDADTCNVFLTTCEALEPFWFPLFLLLFRTGLRLGEAAALRWGSVDLARRQVVVVRSITTGASLCEGEAKRLVAETSPKSNRSRVVPLAEDLYRVLQARRRNEADRVFSAPNGGPALRENLIDAWRRVIVASKLPMITPHDARHSFASQLVAAGENLYAVKELLGHASIATTQRYAHLGPSSGVSAIRSLATIPATVGSKVLKIAG